MYRSFIRPFLFKIDPEKIHNQLFRWMETYKNLPFVRSAIREYCKISSPFTFHNLTFKNRIGLSAGFDKSGVAFDELADFGFGFLELGTVTPNHQNGNPSPRIFRLVADESLISRTGFNNDGLNPLLERLKNAPKRDYVLGVNINKDADSTGEQIIEDFSLLFTQLYPYVDYFTINWGSIEADMFVRVLERLNLLRKDMSPKKCILIKLPADIPTDILDNVIEMAHKYDADGFIATGPTMNRSQLTHTSSEELNSIGAGGVSGKGLTQRAREVVLYLAKATNRDFLIIGAGGIMNANDAKAMFDAGANLIQIYSAFIYAGPFIVREIGKKNWK